MDDVTIEKLEEWMDTMSISMSSEHKARLLANEKLRPVLKTIIQRVAPKEKVLHAKRLLLYKKLLSQSTDETNHIDSNERLHQLKRYSALKRELKLKEEEFESKRKTYLELAKAVEDLIHKIQVASSMLDEEEKKVMFMGLNNQMLQERVRNWKIAQQDIHETKDVQKLKNAKENIEKMEDTNVMDILDNCQLYISNLLVNKEWDCSSSYEAMKEDMVKYVNGHVKGLHWGTIFEALLHSQKKLQDSIEKLENNNTPIDGGNFENTENCGTSQKVFGENLENLSAKMMYNIYIQNLEIHNANGCGDGWQRKVPLQIDDVAEELKSADSRLAIIDQEIQKKTEECKNKIEQLGKHVEEFNKKMSGIKRVFKLTRKSMKKITQYNVSLDKLSSNMNQLVVSARKEVELFVEIPLVFLERVQFSSGDRIPGYKLLSNFQKLLPFMKRNSKSSSPVLDGALSLAPYDVVIHLFEQLTYFKTLQFTECSLKENGTSITQSKTECFADGNDKLQRMLDQFVMCLSNFEVNMDDVASILEILWSHPLRSIVPWDYVVEGINFADIVENDSV